MVFRGGAQQYPRVAAHASRRTCWPWLAGATPRAGAGEAGCPFGAGTARTGSVLASNEVATPDDSRREERPDRRRLRLVASHDGSESLAWATGVGHLSAPSHGTD